MIVDYAQLAPGTLVVVLDRYGESWAGYVSHDTRPGQLRIHLSREPGRLKVFEKRDIGDVRKVLA